MKHIKTLKPKTHELLDGFSPQERRSCMLWEPSLLAERITIHERVPHRTTQGGMNCTDRFVQRTQCRQWRSEIRAHDIIVPSKFHKLRVRFEFVLTDSRYQSSLAPHGWITIHWNSWNQSEDSAHETDQMLNRAEGAEQQHWRRCSTRVNLWTRLQMTASGSMPSQLEV